MRVSFATKVLEPICPVTNKQKPKIRQKDGTICYKIFHPDVFEYFDAIYPESLLNNSKSKFNHHRACYLNSLYYGLCTFQSIDRTYIDANYKKYCTTALEYYIERANGNVELGKELYKNRQSTTSIDSFVKRYGEEIGLKKFNEHFKNIHTINSGEKHWTQNLETTFVEYLQQKHDETEQQIKDRISGRRKLVDMGKSEAEISEWFTAKALKNKRPMTPAEIENYKQKMRVHIDALKESGEYYHKYGCWVACYNYAKLHNIEYTDKNRVDIWNIIFNTGDPRYWKNKGFSDSEAMKKTTLVHRQTSMQSELCFAELSKIFEVEIETEQPFKRYRIDGLIVHLNLVIEYFGDYWHCNPTIYEPDYIANKRKNIPASKIWEKDARKLKALRDAGYHVFVIWESDWMKNREETISNLKQFINERV